jgi:uncharacterized membrane protein
VERAARRGRGADLDKPLRARAPSAPLASSTHPPAPAPPAKLRAFDPLDLRQARARLLLSVVLGLATSAVLALFPAGAPIAVRVVAGWDVAATALLSLAWAIIWRSDSAMTRKRAAAEDPGRNTVSIVVLMASTFSLFAAAAVLRQAKTLAPSEGLLLVGLCLGAVACAWSLTHTAYTLRYAHLYYRDDDPEGGLVFPGDGAPDYLDFAYFSFTVGMCFQVSDVTITGRSIRRAVLGHAILSFAHNTAILALALNLAFGLLT